MKNSSKKKSRISTSKKVALAILGALTILTLVNLIEAAVNKQHHSDAIAVHKHIDEDHHIAIHEEEEIHVHAEVKDFNFKFDIDDKNFDIRFGKGSKYAASGDVVMDKSLEVSEGELLSVHVGDADINIETHNEENAHIVISLDGKDMRKAREYFDNQNFEVTQDGDGVYLRTNPVKRNFNWDETGDARIYIDIAIPEIFNVDVKTSDGDIAMSSLEGDVSLHTSDGDIITKSLYGSSLNLRTSDGDIITSAFEADDISIRTSDGDIKIEDLIAEKIMISTSDGDIRGNSLEGVAAVSTSDGDIFLSSLHGEELNLRTSDGEIVVEKIVSEVSKIQSSDGSIQLREVSGDLTAKTSSGDLRVSLLDATNVYLRTGDGNIQVEAPKDYTATLYLKGERVRVSPGFAFTGEIKDDSADGKINGGGYSFEARTSDGEVIFREN